MNDDKVYICLALHRWNGCILEKNFCCGHCEMLESCLIQFKKFAGNKIKPCNFDLAIDCELKEEL